MSRPKNIPQVTKEFLNGHTFLLAQQSTSKGAKVMGYHIEKGYSVTSSLNSGVDHSGGIMKDVDDAIGYYNSIDLGE